MTLKSGFEVTQGHSNRYHSKAWVRFYSNYGSILHHLPDISRYWSKIMIFFHTPLHTAPPLGGSSRNITIPFGVGKPVWWGYPMVKNVWRYICNRLDSIPACDGRTDRRTSCDGIVRATHTRRAVKIHRPVHLWLWKSLVIQNGWYVTDENYLT